jgi:hypothetical protein
MIRLLCALVLLGAASAAHADVHPQEYINEWVASRLEAEASACDKGAALDQSFCLRDRLASLRRELNGVIDKAVTSVSDSSGKKAEDQIRANIRKAQMHWEAYVSAQCGYDAVPAQAVRSSSGALHGQICEARKILERIAEVRNEYLNDQDDWPLTGR